jgi:hypothetical protein
MSLYNLTPKPGLERYAIQGGWNPHRTYLATVVDLIIRGTRSPFPATNRAPFGWA